MGKEASYLLWNAFLVGMLVLSHFTGVAFPSVIVGVFAGIEITAWIFVIMFRKTKEVSEAVSKSNLLKAWRMVLEAFLCFFAFYMGFKKIGCAWAIIVFLYTIAGILVNRKHQKEHKCA